MKPSDDEAGTLAERSNAAELFINVSTTTLLRL
jgi:hypothetical protein